MLNGHLSHQARAYLTCSVLIPVSKPGGGIRPIAVSEVFYRLTSLYELHLVRDLLPKIFEPIQLGVGCPGGAERAVHVLRAGMELYGDDSILLKCDIRNAFNERKREQLLRPIWRLAHWAYSASSPLLVMDRVNIAPP